MQRHTTRWLALSLCTSALVACGDDSAVGGSSTGGSNNGGSNDGGDTNVGAGSQGGDTNVGAGNQGGDANGGNGSGGDANGGSGQGGGVNAGADGANCMDDTDCDGGFCLAENLTGIPGGMCSEDCTASETCTSATSSCVQVAATLSVCLKDCDPNTAGSCGAPATLSCDEVKGAPEGGLCWGYCDMDSECTSAGKECHDEPLGNCAPPEICDNGTDDDFDGNADCADDECGALPACAAGTCAAPTVLTDAVVTSSTTVGATNVSDPSCSDGGAAETVFSYTSTVTGGLFVDMFSNGDLVVYVRTDCDDDTTEQACTAGGGAAELKSTQTPISAGETVYIVVEGYTATDEEGFDIVAQALTEVCDDFIDADLDGSLDCADTADCAGTPECTPGATALNGTCTDNNNCASVAGADPVCLLSGPTFVNLDMCSEWCNLAANDCGANRQCVDVGLNEGICFSNCTTNANCPAGFECVDLGNPSDGCLPAVPAAWDCDVTYYNANDGCDCGCGVFDPDCADATAGSCDFCDDPGSCSENVVGCPGDIDPVDNATCN